MGKKKIVDYIVREIKNDEDRFNLYDLAHTLDPDNGDEVQDKLYSDITDEIVRYETENGHTCDKCGTVEFYQPWCIYCSDINWNDYK